MVLAVGVVAADAVAERLFIERAEVRDQLQINRMNFRGRPFIGRWQTPSFARKAGEGLGDGQPRCRHTHRRLHGWRNGICAGIQSAAATHQFSKGKKSKGRYFHDPANRPALMISYWSAPAIRRE
jgi:hypothetical protein